MKYITKTNIYYMVLVLFYMLISYLIQFVPVKYLSINIILSLGQIIIIIPTLIYLFFTKFKPFTEIRWKRLSISNILITLLLTYLCMPLLTLVNYISMFFVENNIEDIFNLLSDRPLWVNLFFIAFLPAVVEETVFRGVLFHSYRKRNIFRAILISAVLFGLFHLNVNQFLYAVIMGVIFALVIEATGSIFTSMIMHFVFNANSVILYYLVTNVFQLPGEELTNQLSTNISNFETYQLIITTTMLVGTAIISTILAVLVFVWLCKRNGKLEHVKNIIKRPYRKVCNNEYGRMISIPLLTGIIICVSYIIYFDFVR